MVDKIGSNYPNLIRPEAQTENEADLPANQQNVNGAPPVAPGNTGIGANPVTHLPPAPVAANDRDQAATAPPQRAQDDPLNRLLRDDSDDAFSDFMYARATAQAEVENRDFRIDARIRGMRDPQVRQVWTNFVNNPVRGLNDNALDNVLTMLDIYNITGNIPGDTANNLRNDFLSLDANGQHNFITAIRNLDADITNIVNQIGNPWGNSNEALNQAQALQQIYQEATQLVNRPQQPETGSL